MSWPPPPGSGERPPELQDGPTPSSDPSAGWPPPTPSQPAPPAAPQAAEPAPGPAGGWRQPAVTTPPVSDGLVTAVRVLLWLQVAAAALLSLARLAYAGRLADAGPTQLETFEIALGLSLFLWFAAVGVPAVVCWCLWQSRTHRRLESLRPQAGFRTSPGWGVGAWFVPVANLFVPFRAVADLWRNSAPPGSPGPDPTPRSVAWWWAGLVGFPLVLTVAAFIIGFALAAGGSIVGEAQLVRADAMVGLVQAAAFGVAAWFAAQLVTGIHRRVRALEAAADPRR